MPNVYVLTDENGNEIGRREYDAFGRVISETGDWSQSRFGFSPNWMELKDSGGRFVISPTRIYDNETGRYLSRDPVGSAVPVNASAPGNALGKWKNTAFEDVVAAEPVPGQGPPNSYAYLENSPFSGSDATGLLGNTSCYDKKCVAELNRWFQREFHKSRAWFEGQRDWYIGYLYEQQASKLEAELYKGVAVTLGTFGAGIVIGALAKAGSAKKFGDIAALTKKLKDTVKLAEAGKVPSHEIYKVAQQLAKAKGAGAMTDSIAKLLFHGALGGKSILESETLTGKLESAITTAPSLVPSSSIFELIGIVDTYLSTAKLMADLEAAALGEHQAGIDMALKAYGSKLKRLRKEYEALLQECQGNPKGVGGATVHP